jgi:carboxypeptidase family protein
VIRSTGVAAVLVVASSAAWAQSSPRTDSTGTVAGVVLVRDGAVPLPYSVVSAPSLARERFTNDHGAFTLTDLPPGPLVLRIRHIGYSPAEVTVNVRAGGVDSIRVSLSHIVVRLSTMEVHGRSECNKPGAPAVADDSAFALVFDQLRQNADQFRLLTQTYPFRYSTERIMMHTQVNGDVRVDQVDTIVLDSRATWTYKPGVVLSNGDGIPGYRPVMLNIPTLVHFADHTFLDNHCFLNGGYETVDGAELLRIDFIAASRIKDPDVDGSMYLDPSSFQIRRSVIRLSHIPRTIPTLRETEATTWFTDVLASISMIAGISSVNRMNTARARPTSTASTHEEQRLIRIEFLRGMPGENVKKP